MDTEQTPNPLADDGAKLAESFEEAGDDDSLSRRAGCHKAAAAGLTTRTTLAKARSELTDGLVTPVPTPGGPTAARLTVFSEICLRFALWHENLAQRAKPRAKHHEPPVSPAQHVVGIGLVEACRVEPSDPPRSVPQLTTSHSPGLNPGCC